MTTPTPEPGAIVAREDSQPDHEISTRAAMLVKQATRGNGKALISLESALSKAQADHLPGTGSSELQVVP